MNITRTVQTITTTEEKKEEKNEQKERVLVLKLTEKPKPRVSWT